MLGSWGIPSVPSCAFAIRKVISPPPPAPGPRVRAHPDAWAPYLMRWTHPVLHLRAPDVMAPVAASILEDGPSGPPCWVSISRRASSHLYGVDDLGRRVLSKRVRRAKLGAMIANLPPCVIGMEACSTSHHWARRFQAFGHRSGWSIRTSSAPYVKGNKNDELDAEAICEASSRPNMTTVEQHDVQALHRARERLVRWRTALINQIRGIIGRTRHHRGSRGSPGWPRPSRRDRRSHQRADRPVA
jgi:Transposase